MRFKTGFKPKISTKILFALLWLSLISLILFGYIVFSGMRELGNYALKSSIALGNQAVDDSVKALKNQAEKSLLKLAEDQADLSGALLEEAESEVNIVASFASHLWQTSISIPQGHPYSQQENPEDIFKASVYTLAPDTDPDKAREEVELSGGMDAIFPSILHNNPNINTICLATESGVFRSYPWRPGRDPSYDPRQRYWYKQAAEEGRLIWTQPYIHAATRELIVTCACPFYDAQSKLIGVAGADITLAEMQDRIISAEVGKSGYVCLIDQDGNVIARPDLEPGNTKWDEAYETENLFNSPQTQLRNIAKDMAVGNCGIKSCEFSDGERYIAYAPISNTHWSLAIVMPIKEIIEPTLATKNKITIATSAANHRIDNRIKGAKNTLIGVFIVIIFFVFLTADRISKRITRPILALDQGVKILGKGNLGYRMDIKTGDEIEDLAGAFNKMGEDLKVYIEKLTETTAVKERMEKELNIARDIQMGIVPKTFPPFPARSEFDVYAILSPAREVGGDFYDFFILDNDYLFFLIGDVSGKGVPASLFMAASVTLIRAIARRLKSPAQILSALNQEIVRDNNSGLFISIFCGLMNIKTGEVSYANGGHNPPLLISKNAEPEFLKTPEGMLAGIFKNVIYQEKKITLQPDDAIYMYTDGVTEAFNRERKVFSENRLKKEVAKYKQVSIKEMVTKTLDSIRTFSEGAPPSDDITIMVLRYFR